MGSDMLLAMQVNIPDGRAESVGTEATAVYNGELIWSAVC